MLPEAGLKSIYATGEDEPFEFFLSCLINSESLDLGLGYFSSSGIRTLAVGFAFFIKRGGKMRVIFNNVLSSQDKDAIQKGLDKDISTTIENNLINDIAKLTQTLSRNDTHFFNCLSWLIANNRIEIIATIPKRSKNGIVHQKFGIFKDSLNHKVAFSGSVNFSQYALLRNVEDLTCDFSWDSGAPGLSRIEYFERLFEKTWTGISAVSQIISIDQVKAVISKSFPVKTEDELLEEEKMLVSEILATDDLPEEYKTKIREYENKLLPVSKISRDAVTFPVLRDYQERAIQNWKDNGYVGLLEMATGTGKTFTALTALVRLHQERKRLFVIISCPFIHLAEQWTVEAMKFGLESTLVGESKSIWVEDAARQAQLFKRGKIDFVLFITTNASFKSPPFQKIIGPCLAETLIIIDEAHYAGAESIRKLLPMECKFRLGLSATPARHGDDEGTFALFSYFNKVVFSFPIDQAIGVFLTPYYYHPIPVELTDEEFDEYVKLTNQIGRLAGKNDVASQSKLDLLSIMRARVQNNSSNKIEWLRSSLPKISLEFSLFYCGDQIFDSAKRVIGNELNNSIHEFTSRQSRAERKKLLEDFSNQKIQSLIAMKCLDEGIDVPPTRLAFFLASSSNPREFIQRRGRVLRKYPGKEYATIYDLISIPPMKYINAGRSSPNFQAVKSAFHREYSRVQDFADMALNKYSSMHDLFIMADKLDVLDID